MKWKFDAHKFGAALRDKRDAGKIRVRTAAAEIGCSQGSISRIERAQEVEIPIFLRVCDWLDIPPGEFFKQVEG